VVRRLAAAVLVIAAAFAASAAEARDPQILDSQRVNNREERVVFRIPRGQGLLDQIRFRGDDGMLLRAVEIIFEGGQRQNMDFIDRLPPGAESRPIGIDADLRAVEQVTLWKRPSLRPGTTNVQLIGVLRPEPPPRGGQFSVIDSQTIDVRNDRVVFHVGRREGRFAAIKFRPVDGGLLTGSLEIEYANRERQTFNVVERLAPGQESRPLDLSGEARRIETVTLWKRPGLRPGRVTVELLGFEVPDRDRGAPPPWAGIGPQIPRGWVLFGAQTVEFRGDRDIIPVGPEVGRFDRIALRVQDNDIFLREITVTYANGERDRKIIETAIPANSQTRPIDLKGDRFIRDIELVYRSRPGGGKPAIVEVYGDFARDWFSDRGGYRDFNRGWALLGAQRASMFSKDSDVIPVGERFGRLKALRFTARREDIRIYGVRVVYGNGEAEDVPVSAQLKEGQTTPAFDLKGWGRGRFIDRIELKYRSKLTLKGQGTIEAWGLQ
jgi:hypothetical protein